MTKAEAAGGGGGYGAPPPGPAAGGYGAPPPDPAGGWGAGGGGHPGGCGDPGAAASGPAAGAYGAQDNLPPQQQQPPREQGGGRDGGGRGGGRGRDGGGRGAPAPGGPPGLFTPGDWTCGSCMNVNWERRNKCNQCGAPKPGTGDQRREGQVGHAPRQGLKGVGWTLQGPVLFFRGGYSKSRWTDVCGKEAAVGLFDRTLLSFCYHCCACQVG
jgi:RNA-binding protein FUS